MSACGSKRTGRARSRWPGAEADQLAARYLAEPWRAAPLGLGAMTG